MSDSAARQWFPFAPTSRPGCVRLICFPFAGAGASVYRAWSKFLPPVFLVSPVQLKGREERWNETPHRTMAEIVAELGPALADMCDVPSVFFGYSMGALVAFELVHYLRQAGLPMPSALIVGARGAPHMPSTRTPIWNLPDDRFLAEIRELGGVSEEILQSPELLEFVMPALRADLQVCETYRYQQLPPLALPLVALGGVLDRHVPQAHLEAWQAHTSLPLTTELFPGGHFFLREHRDLMLRSLISFLTRLAL